MTFCSYPKKILMNALMVMPLHMPDVQVHARDGNLLPFTLGQILNTPIRLCMALSDLGRSNSRKLSRFEKPLPISRDHS